MLESIRVQQMQEMINDGQPRGSSSPAEGGNLLAALIDIKKCFMKLDQKDQTVLRMRHYDNATLQQIELSPQLKAGAFHVSLYFTFQRPKAHLRTNGELKDSAPSLHRQKPDLDNLAKLILDRTTRSGKFWADDCQVIDLSVFKDWCRDGDQPGVRVMIISEP